MYMLVINSGSSSIKYALFEEASLERIRGGAVERIGEPGSPVTNHTEGMEQIRGALGQTEPLLGMGHRVVHGGELFREPALIDAGVMNQIRALAPLAPLHNPANLTGIEAARDFAPGVPQVAVFDTAFHQTMPPQAFRYALPEELYRTHQVRRYGFHGTSHQYVANRAAAFLEQPLASLNLITLHLGNGASAAAVAQGRSVDTTMGMTPLEGLVMGTRSGDLDPAIPAYLAGVLDRTLPEVMELLNGESGLKGLCGENDMRDVLHLAKDGDAGAELALDLYAYRIRKTIGAYVAVLGRVDAVVFTGGIGEHASSVRARICEEMSALGIALNPAANREARGPCSIHAPSSRISLLVFSTDEERAIAEQAVQTIRKL